MPRRCWTPERAAEIAHCDLVFLGFFPQETDGLKAKWHLELKLHFCRIRKENNHSCDRRCYFSDRSWACSISEDVPVSCPCLKPCCIIYSRKWKYEHFIHSVCRVRQAPLGKPLSCKQFLYFYEMMLQLRDFCLCNWSLNNLAVGILDTTQIQDTSQCLLSWSS